MSGGELICNAIADGQYFWVEGSIFNDGLHKSPATDMKDERFTGRLVLLAVPDAVVRMSEEIDAWSAKNADVLDSPYQSESFGGYSYSKGSASSQDGGYSAGWQSQFSGKLRQWRKLSRDWV